LDGERFLQELRTLSCDYTVWDDDLVTFTANVTETGRCFLYFHLKQLPWTKKKLREIDMVLDEILGGLKSRGIGEVYTMASSQNVVERFAPHFGFEPLLSLYNADDTFIIYKREIV
jgi:hypothetical protein